MPKNALPFLLFVMVGFLFMLTLLRARPQKVLELPAAVIVYDRPLWFSDGAYWYGGGASGGGGWSRYHGGYHGGHGSTGGHGGGGGHGGH